VSVGEHAIAVDEDQPDQAPDLYHVSGALRSNGYRPALALGHPEFEPSPQASGAYGWLGRQRYAADAPIYPGSLPEARSRLRQDAMARFKQGKLRVASTRSLPDYERFDSTQRDDVVQAMLLGLAIGDALGNTSESMLPSERRSRFGEITGYLPNPHAGGRCVGLPSDDTQLTFWSLECLLAEGLCNLPALATSLRKGRIYGIGRTCRAWLRALDENPGDPWAARQHSAGNGALMRVLGLYAPHAWFSPLPPQSRMCKRNWLWDVLLGSALTHDDPSSAGACVGYCAVIEALLRTSGSPSLLKAEDVIDTFVQAAQIYEGDAQLESRVPGSNYRGPCWKLVNTEVRAAVRAGKTPLEAGQAWYSGAFLLETVPTLLHLIATYLDSPRECVIRAVNDTWDNDTIAALAAAAMGARHGFDAFEPAWREGLLGRTGEADDGHVQAVIRRLEEFGGEATRHSVPPEQ
jgi:ADP-ribosylglycohydrolase